MSGQTSVPNYRETLFEYPDLTGIHGEPTYESLRVIQNQLKANARSIHTTLGGGQHGHLGLVLTPAQYALLSPHPYVRPHRPPPLVIPAYQLPHVVQTAQNNHNDAVKLFNECNNVEQALRQQIIKAVNDAYLTALRNRLTNTIDAPIPIILDYLFTNHGRVTPAMLQNEEKDVKEMHYEISHPIDIIFNKVEDLNDLSIAAHADYTEPQLINIAYVIINATGKYQHYIRDWSRLPPAQKNWASFKTHFRQAHQELRETGDLQVRDTSFNSANLVQDVIDGVQHALQAADPPDSSTPDVINHLANNAAQQQLMPQLMQQMMLMMEQMNSLQRQMNSPPPTNSNGSSSTISSSSSSRQRRTRTNTSHYCWSHGACAHPSTDCRSQRSGHQTAATFTNKMGGSTAFCPTTTT